jgi:SulP family sulfate permease
VLGSVTFLLGLDFLVEWVYTAWFKLSKTDYLIVILILITIGTAGFLEGVGVGMLIAVVLFVINYSRINVAKYVLSGVTYQSHAARTLTQRRLLRQAGEQIYILDLQGFLFFGTANKLLNQICQRLHQVDLLALKFVVLDFRDVIGLDSSAVLSFTKLKQIAQQQQFGLIFTQLSPGQHRQLHSCLQGPCCQIFHDLDHAVEWCENQILETIPQRRRRSLPLALQLDALLTKTEHIPVFMGYLEKLDVEVGQVLFKPGDPSDCLYLIEIGQVTLFLPSEKSQICRLQSLGVGNLVGEMDFYLNLPRQTSAVVEQPSTLYRLSKTAAHHMQQENPEVAATFQEFVIRLLSDRLASTYKEVNSLLQ